MAEAVGAGAVAADPMSGPALAEGVAEGGEFADQVGQGLGVGLRPTSARRVATFWSATASQPG